MKILKDNYKKATNNEEKIKKFNPYPRKLVCENCGSELEYEKNDLRMGALGCVYLDCPCCGHDNMLEENEDSIELTMNNVEFPTHFFHISTDDGASDCCNDEHIRKYIREAINYFRENKEEYDWGGHITGNLYIHVHRWSGDEEYEITISNDFYSTYIPFESVDY